jgi:DNA-binding MarR family transcriptional regulator
MAPKSLDTNIIYLCGAFSHGFHQALTLEFKNQGILVTVEQFSILALLFYQSGINQKEVGMLLSRDKTTIARVIANMEKNKMISRVTDKNDSRGKLIYLTSKGEAIQKKAVELSGKLYLKAIKGIKRSQLKEGLRLMTTMITSMNSK